MRSPLRVLLCALAASLAWGSFAPVAVAQPSASDEAAGRVAFDDGLRALQERRFRDAEGMLREALRRRPTPVTRYNLALALRGVGRYIEAASLFESYLREPEVGAAPERLAAIRDELAVILRSVARLDLTVTPATATLQIDGQPARFEGGTLRLDPGAHVFEFEAEGHARDRRELTLAPGSQVVLAIALRALPTEGHLIVEPSVPGATVSIDARAAGTGRVDREVAPGEHVVEVRAAGHDPWRRTVRVTARGTLRVDAGLVATRSASRPWLIPVAVGGGALVVAGVVTAIALATRGDEAPARGTWGNFPVP